MDNAVFLNRSGAIVTQTTSSFIPALHIAPYFETVVLPVVSVDSSALYGDHPENLATLTYTSGAALTFFVDSVPGGNDSSGDGSADNPWRNMNTASKFLACASCTLRKAAPYIQLKVRGTVDYYIPGDWKPMGFDAQNFILAGWGGRADLTSADAGYFVAGYFVDIECEWRHASCAVASNCRFVGSSGGSRVSSAVACEFRDAFDGRVPVLCDCSGGNLGTLSCAVVRGGAFEGGRNYELIYADWMYSTTATAIGSRATAIMLQGAAVEVTAVASGSATSDGFALAIRCNGSGAYLKNCTLSAEAVASGVASWGSASAVAVGGNPYRTVCVGGTYAASATAHLTHPTWATSAVAAAYVYSGGTGATCSGVQTALFATASLVCSRPNGTGTVNEEESVYDFGASCVESRWRKYSSGVLISAGGTSYGGLCQ